MTKGKRGRLCGSAGGEMVMKAVLEGGGWEMSPSPSNKQPLEERNGAALFGGGGGIVHSPSSTRNKQSSSEMPEGAPRQPSMLARYLHAARGVPVEGFHLSK